MNNKIASLEKFLVKRNWTGGLITSRQNIFYLTGFDYDPHERFVGIFIFPGQSPLIVLPEMELKMLLEAGWRYDYICYKDSDNVWRMMAEYFDEKISMITDFAVEETFISLKYVRMLQQMLPNIQLQNLDQALSEMRIRKSPEEIKKLRIAAQYADYAIQAGIDALYEGVSELEVLGEIEYKLKKAGLRDMSFSTMVLFGSNSSNPHGVPGENKLQPGDTIIFDLGVKYEGYCSDITRTFVFKELRDEVKEMYELVLKANLAALQECRAGNKMRKIDEAARTVISDGGYAKYFPHRIGHGLGIEVHEEPSLHAENEEILREGMVLTVEPGIYIPGVGGVRIEDDVVIGVEGKEVLTKFQKKLHVVKGKTADWK
ncbi:Xaa-Pro peptidase family protein [Bacillus sp. CMF12]|uniref:M24 family metallopeptidase n=1 Tax=Bacillaceae TaxID=186817 RepID=UPI001FB2A3DA|nr:MULTISPECIES: Xaa-Pro peptidase family protein [Bacillaceae]UOE53720.1 aminopeptidase P family protein [Cytobacillus oceanisediminis]USK48161.1 Xaa-Pro peptidase family protein [Bacillus sp. CMF12]